MTIKIGTLFEFEVACTGFYVRIGKFERSCIWAGQWKTVK